MAVPEAAAASRNPVSDLDRGSGAEMGLAEELKRARGDGVEVSAHAGNGGPVLYS